ncbi:MAG: S8 family peptidase [Bacteroidota bacterium]|nr:S8 family peptidase [Bacteroidota bacterium]
MKSNFTFFLVLFSFIAIPVFALAQTIQKNEKQSFSHFKLSEHLTKEDYLPGKIILKIKPEFKGQAKSRSIEIPVLKEELEQLGVTNISKKFPDQKNLTKSSNDKGDQLVDLSLIYEIDISDAISLEKAINKLYQTGVIEYAEPIYVPKLLYTPNDINISNQYSLELLKAYQGWDISKGDTSVVIGILDTGTDFNHPDLTGNIKYNYNDPINGIDDDGDGYIDNFHGWDLGENNNYPQSNSASHGVHVTGIAAAGTNNSTGIAGVGFNCKYLPVKISNLNGALTQAYNGIVYAADQGCHIINCSWGSVGGGQFGQDIINYATFNKGALVVAAAGNNSKDENFYPASYKNSLSVGATNKDDKKWAGSNYGYSVDLCAPGDGIYSTLPDNSYGSSSGTSMAAPNAAGAAALVKSRFPSYSALQIAEQLKVTSDNIELVNADTLKSKLGTGRINIYRALTQTNSPSVVLMDQTFKGNKNDYFIVGDTVSISCFFKNYLAPATNASVSLKANVGFIKVIKGSSYLGPIATLGSSNNVSDPFQIVILKDAPINSEASFTLTVQDGNYKAGYFFTLIVNVDFINVKINDVATTITSTGKIGYNKAGQQYGLGFTYLHHPTLLYEAGLMIGTSENNVSSCVRGESGKTNQDFSSILRVIPNALKVSDFDLEGKFNDNISATPLNISVNHNAYAWSSVGNRKYIIVLYDIINKGNSTINNLHAGLFADWDIMDYSLNRVEYDSQNNMGYAYSMEASGLYTAIKLLSSTAPAIHYAIDNINGGAGGVDLTSGFDNYKKFITLSTNRNEAGANQSGNDIIDVMSTGPYNLAPGDTAFVAFALIAGEDLDDIKASATAAQYKYDNEIPHNRNHKPIDENEIWLGDCYPNPTKNLVSFEFYLPSPAPVELVLYNSLGQKVAVLTDDTSPEGLNKITFDTSQLNAGVYIYRLSSNSYSQAAKLTVIK